MQRLAGLILMAIAGAVAAQAVQAQRPPLWATLHDPPPLPKPDESGFVENDGARLYYAVFHKGGARPVILLHGGAASSESWGFEVPKLAVTHEVIVMDSRGQGRSSGLDRIRSYEQMECDVLAVMDRAGVRTASVVGASDGADIGLVMAIRDPKRLNRLFAWGGNFDTHAQRTAPPEPEMKAAGAAYMGRMAADYRRLSPTPEQFPAMLKALGELWRAQPNLTPADLGRITASTVIADGEHEQFIARAHTELMARSIPHARLVIIPDVSHGGPQQDPEAFHRAVASLLDP